MPRVTRLSITPVKGLQIQRAERLELNHLGALGDRRFYLVDARGRMVNGKQLGLLASVAAHYDDAAETLTMTFPDGLRHAARVSLGAEISTRFFSLELPARLVLGPWARALSAHAGRDLRLVESTAARSAVDRGPAGGVSLISAASIARLSKATAQTVDARRFRMLIEVDGLSAHGEDEWIDREARIGGVRVRFNGHVGRCLVTGQNPLTGVADVPMLDLLRDLRSGARTTEPIAFGVYGSVLEPGTVEVGDELIL